MAGFEVTTNGRFWVTAEARAPGTDQLVGERDSYQLSHAELSKGPTASFPVAPDVGSSLPSRGRKTGACLGGRPAQIQTPRLHLSVWHGLSQDHRLKMQCGEFLRRGSEASAARFHVHGVTRIKERLKIQMLNVPLRKQMGISGGNGDMLDALNQRSQIPTVSGVRHVHGVQSALIIAFDRP